MKVYLVEIKAATDSIGTETTLYFSTEGYVTSPSETPPNQFFENRVKQPALMRRDIYANGTTMGQSRVGYGEVVLVNNDGGLDYMLDYGFDGREIIIRYGDTDAAYPTEFTTILVGTMEQIELGWKEVVIRVRDRQAELAQKQIQTTKYAGSNSLPNGLEGVEGDIEGRPKPITYGKVFNVTPVLVNTSRLIYQVNDGAISSVDQVYDRGLALTKGVDYTSQADMETNAPAAGNFRVWPAGGYFRITTNPTGQITADVVQGAAASNRTAAQILKSIAVDRGGVVVGDVDSGDVTALDTDNSSEIGIYVDSESDIASVMDQVANSVGAWWGFDATGKLRMQRLEVPSGSPATVLTTTEILDIERTGTNDADRAIPAYRVKVKYKKFYVVQESDLAGAVTDVRRNELKLNYRESVAEDLTIKDKHLLSPELEFETLLITAANAATEASRLLDIYKVRRDVVTCRANLDTGLANVLDLGDVVEVDIPRFGYSGGKLFRVIGIQTDLRRNHLELTLWG